VKWPRNVAQFELSLSSTVYLSLTHFFLNNLLLEYHKSYFTKNRFFWLFFCRTQRGPDFNHFDVVGPKSAEFGEITQNNGITPFKVIQGHRFGTNVKPVCDFLCVSSGMASFPRYSGLLVDFWVSAGDNVSF